MNKIYLVMSYYGKLYEDTGGLFERAFANKKDAEEYAKKINNEEKPQFITNEFENALDDSYSDFSDKYPTTEYDEEKEKKYVIKSMYEKGFFVTEQMLDEYNDWLENDFIECKVREVELY